MSVLLELIRGVGDQRELDGVRVLPGSEPGPVGNPEDVRVDGDFDLPEHHIENDAGRLSADARQGLERVAVRGNLTAVLLDELLTQADEVLGLHVVQADGLQIFLHPVDAELVDMGSTRAGDGNLLFAGEVSHYDEPWQNPDDARKVNGVARYSQGTADDGFTVTGMAYANKWNSTDQVPLRAITSGELDRFGEIDPTDGGNANRFSLSARAVKSDDAGWWKANFYAVKSTLDLYNNFTWFLNDPVKGDQFHQHDGRTMVGGNASRTLQGTLGGVRTETTLGIQTRYDDIDLASPTPFSGRSCQTSAATGSARAASASMRRTRSTGPTGCGPHWAGVAIITTPRSIRSSMPTIPDTPRPPSAARSSEWCSGRSTRLSCFSGPARASTATMRAAPLLRKARPIRPRNWGLRRCWCAPGGRRPAFAPGSYRALIPR